MGNDVILRGQACYQAVNFVQFFRELQLSREDVSLLTLAWEISEIRNIPID